jgi:Ca2+-binding RTX toxin-like protein
MRRVTLMVAAMALMVSLLAAVAYAATIEGTNQSEVLQESSLSDTIKARRGGDAIDATEFSKTTLTDDTDVVNGNAGDDIIRVDDGDGQDTANGGNGVDFCVGDATDVLINCETP